MKRARRCYTPGPRHQCRVRVAHQPRGRGPCKAPLGSLFRARHPKRFQRGLDACRARQRATPTQTSNARPLADLTPIRRRFASTPRAQPGYRSRENRVPFEATKRALLACTNACPTRRRDPGRASLQTRPAAWHGPSALRDASIADDHFAAVAQRTLAFSCKAAPP